MQDIFGSVRRSFNFAARAAAADDPVPVPGPGGLIERIGSSIRRSRIGIFSPSTNPTPPAMGIDDAPPIRWRKGDLIGCGAFGRVYMGMNLDSGELIAVKQVLIAANSASKEKTQAHIRELEEEVKLLKNLSHPNIVRYLGTIREEESLNILLEFVPGGSISSLLGKFGSFPESVIRMYTKQLLLGLEYLHKNGIMHRDIKGANILVDNKGCIKLADFGASKKVVELATINGAKSMKGTPYWMAPEVILQTGHSFSADIWSVGCTVIEMATGKPPWSQQYQEVAALFHIGTTKSHPPIPEHLSAEAKDFLLKCLQKEPHLRLSPSDLLQHSFVTGEYQESHSLNCTSTMENSGTIAASTMDLKKFLNLSGTQSFWKPSNCDDDMCQIDDKDDFAVSRSLKFDSISPYDDLNKSFNPMCEPTDDWPCKFDESPGLNSSGTNLSCETINNTGGSLRESGRDDNEFAFPSGSFAAEDEDEVTESKIRAFLDEKAIDLKKLQTPLYEFYNSLNAAACSTPVRSENVANMQTLPPKSRSPSRLPSRRLSHTVDNTIKTSPGSQVKCLSNADEMQDRALQEIQQPPQPDELKDLLYSKQETVGPSASFSERQRKWKEELDEELERQREMMRLAGLGGKTPSPKDRLLNRQRERSRFADAGN